MYLHHFLLFYIAHFLFIVKDSTTVWKKYSFQPQTSRTDWENIMKILPGPSHHTKFLKESIKIWDYLINEEMVEIIVNFMLTLQIRWRSLPSLVNYSWRVIAT